MINDGYRPTPGILAALENDALAGYQPGVSIMPLGEQAPAGRSSAASLVGLRRPEARVVPPIDTAPVRAIGVTAVPNVIEVTIDPSARTFRITPGSRAEQ